MKRTPIRSLLLLVTVLAMTAFAAAGCAGAPAATNGPAGDGAPIERTATSAPEAALATRIVTVDINPSVELEVDEAGLVVEARALNADAEAVLATVTLAGLPATDAVKLIVDAAVQLGYLDPAATEAYVAIGVEDNGDGESADEDQLEQDLQDSAEEGLEENGSAGQVDVSAIAHERIEAARALGISPGRLNLIDRLAAALGQTREQVLATYGESKVKEIMKALNAARPEGDEDLDEGGDADEGADESIEQDESSDDDADEDIDRDEGDASDDEGDGEVQGEDYGKHNGEKNHEGTPEPTAVPTVEVPAA